MGKATLEGKKLNFKSLAISKVLHSAIITKLLNTVIEEVKKIPKNFLWDSKKVKIKQSTLRNDYKDGGLKSVDIEHKIASLKFLGSNDYTLKTFMNGKLFLCNI